MADKQENLLSNLERIVEMVRSGEVQAMAYIAITNDSYLTGTGSIPGSKADFVQMLGALSKLTYTLNCSYAKAELEAAQESGKRNV